MVVIVAKKDNTNSQTLVHATEPGRVGLFSARGFTILAHLNPLNPAYSEPDWIHRERFDKILRLHHTCMDAQLISVWNFD